MFRNVLLVERSSPTFKSRLQQILGENLDLTYEFTDWNSLNPSALSRCCADCVVLVVQPDTVEALSLFQWLQEHPLAIPTLAILP